MFGQHVYEILLFVLLHSDVQSECGPYSPMKSLLLPFCVVQLPISKSERQVGTALSKLSEMFRIGACVLRRDETTMLVVTFF